MYPFISVFQRLLCLSEPPFPLAPYGPTMLFFVLYFVPGFFPFPLTVYLTIDLVI